MKKLSKEKKNILKLCLISFGITIAIFLIVSSLANCKNYDAKYKYFIVINPKNVKLKGNYI